MKFDAYGPTHGNDERAPRALVQPLSTFTLADEITRLRAESEWRDGDRNSVTLFKELDFRVVLSVMRAGALIHEQDGAARASVQLLEGRAALEVDGAEIELGVGQLATVNSGHQWRLRSETESVVLLTIGWPREKTGV